MNLRTSTLLVIGGAGLLAPIVGCSADNSAGLSGWIDSGALGSGQSNSDGGGAHVDASSSGGGNGSSASSSGAGGGGSSGGSSGSSSGGSSGMSEAGAVADAGHASLDAAGSSDAARNHDGGAGLDANPDTGANVDAAMGSDAGLCADQSAWLVPMNQARAMLNVGEPPLVCDPIAVQVALNYAKQCQSGAAPGMLVHNMNRSASYMALGGMGSLGENIAAGAPTQTPGEAVSLWLSEGPSYNYATNACSGTCGHYTQIVWKSTTGVGCAHASCTSNFFGGGSWEFNVCDFSPPGNFGGQRPY